MIFILIAVGLCAVALVAWEATRLVRKREESVRQRARMKRRSARQKTWDLVFGRRVQKRLSFDPTERRDD